MIISCIIHNTVLWLYRPVARKFYWGVLLKEMWTFSYCSHSANHSPGAVDELIIILWCVHNPHSWGLVNPSIDHVYSWNIHKKPTITVSLSFQNYNQLNCINHEHTWLLKIQSTVRQGIFKDYKFLWFSQFPSS